MFGICGIAGSAFILLRIAAPYVNLNISICSGIVNLATVAEVEAELAEVRAQYHAMQGELEDAVNH